MRDGTIGRLTDDGIAGAINLPILADQLYRSARWLRVFTGARVTLAPAEVLTVLRGA
jgi:hypothetical protein